MTESGYVDQLRVELFQRLADDWQTKWKHNGHGDEFIDFSYVKNKSSLYSELRSDVYKAHETRFGPSEARKHVISIDTLRRLLDKSYQKGFEDRLKDTVSIYLGYDDWEHFKASKNPAPPPAPTANAPVVINNIRVVSLLPPSEAVQDWWAYQQVDAGRKRRWQWLIGLLAVALLSVGSYRAYDYWRTHRTFTPDELDRVQLKLISRSNRYNPCVAKFAYDFSHLNIDSAVVYLSTPGIHDEFQQVLREPTGTFEWSIYKPGVQGACIKYGDQWLKRADLTVESDGWAAWYEIGGKLSTNFRKQDFYVNGTLFLHPNKIIDPAIRSNYFMMFRNVRDFGANLNDCTIEYRLKNSPDEFGISCYEAVTGLHDKNGQAFGVGFSRPGCHTETKNGDTLAVNTGLHTSSILADWNVVRVEIKARQARIYLNGQLIRQNVLGAGDLGRLHLMNFYFKGSGMLDYVRVYDGAGKCTYSDDFDTVPVSKIGGY